MVPRDPSYAPLGRPSGIHVQVSRHRASPERIQSSSSEGPLMACTPIQVELLHDHDHAACLASTAFKWAMAKTDFTFMQVCHAQ